MVINRLYNSVTAVVIGRAWFSQPPAASERPGAARSLHCARPGDPNGALPAWARCVRTHEVRNKPTSAMTTTVGRDGESGSSNAASRRQLQTDA